MMTAKEVVEKAMLDMYSVDELKEKPRIVMLQEIDADYHNFIIKHEYREYGKVYYWMVTLFIVTHKTFPDVCPLVSVSNIAYEPDEAIDLLAETIDKLMKEASV